MSRSVRLFYVVVLLGFASAVQAVTWPPAAAWQPIYRGSGYYADAVNDENPDEIDVVGNATHAAGYWYVDDGGTPLNPADDTLMLRMRVSGDGYMGGNLANYVWQFGFSTDADTGVEFALQVDQASPAIKHGQQVEFVATLPGQEGPPYALPGGTLVFDALNELWTGSLATYSAWSLAADGSNFEGSPDYFLDAAMPMNVFTLHTGLAAPPFSLILTTSADHENINKDHPDNNGPPLGGTDPPTSTQPGVAPEPVTASLSGLAIAALGAVATRRRRGW